MGASSRPIDELSRQELEVEITRLRKLEDRVEALETLVGIYGEKSPDEACLRDIKLAGSPAGNLIVDNRDRIEEVEAAMQGNADGNPRLGGVRNQMLPIHRMYGDLVTNAGHSLNDTQKRAARLFGEFVERVVKDEANKVEASGQRYTLSSGAAEEILLGKHDPDASNLIDGVKKASRSQVIARAMRDVTRLAKFEDCECEEIDGCTHSVVQFRSGRPNVLAASKQSFNESMEAVYNDQTE